jgi:hypothetical protein
MKPNHGKIIVSTSYYDGIVASIKNEYEVSLFTTKECILKDVIDALTLINKGETHKMSLDITVDSKGRYRLLKKWSVE